MKGGRRRHVVARAEAGLASGLPRGELEVSAYWYALHTSRTQVGYY